MSLLGNLLWLILGGGIFYVVGWVFYGLLFIVTIIGIPFGVASFRIAGFAASPFGRQLIDARLLGENRTTGTGFVNLLWFILAGVWLAISHVLGGAILCITVIGIPFGLAHFKMAGAAMTPLGKRIVTNREAEAVRLRAMGAP